jgi:hypothetical protein
MNQHIQSAITEWVDLIECNKLVHSLEHIKRFISDFLLPDHIDTLTHCMEADQLIVVDSLNVGSWNDPYNILVPFFDQNIVRINHVVLSSGLDVFPFLRYIDHIRILKDSLTNRSVYSSTLSNNDRLDFTKCLCFLLLIISTHFSDRIVTPIVPVFMIIHRTESTNALTVHPAYNMCCVEISYNKQYALKEIDDMLCTCMAYIHSVLNCASDKTVSIMTRDTMTWLTACDDRLQSFVSNHKTSFITNYLNFTLNESPEIGYRNCLIRACYSG